MGVGVGVGVGGVQDWKTTFLFGTLPVHDLLKMGHVSSCGHLGIVMQPERLE